MELIIVTLTSVARLTVQWYNPSSILGVLSSFFYIHICYSYLCNVFKSITSKSQQTQRGTLKPFQMTDYDWQTGKKLSTFLESWAMHRREEGTKMPEWVDNWGLTRHAKKKGMNAPGYYICAGIKKRKNSSEMKMLSMKGQSLSNWRINRDGHISI